MGWTKRARALDRIAKERDFHEVIGYDDEHDKAAGVTHLVQQASTRVDDWIIFEHGVSSPLVVAASLLVAAIELLDPEEDDEGNLVAHAKRELELIGEEPEVIEKLVAMVAIFSTMGHSGASASIATGMLNQLLQFKNLRPLTDDPAEWWFVAKGMWGGNDELTHQNIRNSEAFSHDGGKTYYLLSEGGRRGPIHKTTHKDLPVID